MRSEPLGESLYKKFVSVCIENIYNYWSTPHKNLNVEHFEFVKRQQMTVTLLMVSTYLKFIYKCMSLYCHWLWRTQLAIKKTVLVYHDSESASQISSLLHTLMYIFDMFQSNTAYIDVLSSYTLHWDQIPKESGHHTHP